MRKAHSVGLVESIALRLILELQKQIDSSLSSSLLHLSAVVTAADGSSFSVQSGNGNKSDKASLQTILQQLMTVTCGRVKTFKTKQKKYNPPSPCTTVALVEDANAYLGFDPDTTIRLARALFECGLITYHLTDSNWFRDESVHELRDFIMKSFGEEYLSSHAPLRNPSQDMLQEACRPTNYCRFEEIEQLVVGAGLQADHVKLYRIIALR